MEQLTRASLTEKTELEYNNLLKLVAQLWAYKGNYSFNLTSIKTTRGVIYSLYIFRYALVDGVKKYSQPKKVYRKYEGMKKELTYFKDQLSKGNDIYTPYAYKTTNNKTV